MFRGIENIFGQFWWVSLAAMTFILGWWMGRRVISKLVRPRSGYSSGELLAVPMVKRDSVAIRKGNSSAGITSMKLGAIQSDRSSLTPEAARERDYQEQKNKLSAMQKDFDKVNANNLKLSEDHAKLVVQLEAAEIKCKVLEDEKAEQSALATKFKTELGSHADSDKQVDTIQHKLNTMQSDLDAMRQGRTTIEAKLKACEKDRDDARDHLDVESTNVQELSARIEAFERAAAAEAEHREQEAAAAHAQLEIERNRAKAFLDETEMVRKAAEVDLKAREKEHEETRAKLELERERAEKLSAECVALKQSLESVPAIRDKELAELRRELEAERYRALTLASEANAFKLKTETEAEANEAALKSAHQQIEQALAKAERLSAEVERLKQPSGSLPADYEKEREELRAQLEHEREHTKDITAEFEHYKKASITALEASEQERDAARAQLVQDHAHILELTAEIESVNAAAKAIADSIPVMPSQKTDDPSSSVNEAEFNAVLQSKANLEALLASKDAELAQTKAQWQIVMDQVEGMEAEKRRVQSQLQAREGLLNEIKTHHEDIKEKLHTAETALVRTRAELDELRARGFGKEETKSLGRPDDFHSIKGIGRTFEKRLYDNGICTYADLASTTAEKLHELCRPPAHFKRPDYQNWIDQAQQMLER